MMHFAITEEDFNKAYNTARESIEELWFDDFGPEGEEDFEGWAGDVLYDYLGEFLHALNISVVE